jgi:hypothetical protein
MRLHFLQNKVDDLEIPIGLLGEDNTEIGDRDPLLVDGLLVQVPDRRGAAEHGYDDEGEAHNPGVAGGAANAADGLDHAGQGLHVIVLRPPHTGGHPKYSADAWTNIGLMRDLNSS